MKKKENVIVKFYFCFSFTGKRKKTLKEIPKPKKLDLLL